MIPQWTNDIMTSFQTRRETGRTALLTVTAAAVLGLCLCMVTDRAVISCLIAFIPLALLVMASSFEKKRNAFLVLFVMNYFVPVMSHYLFNMPLGLIMDMLIGFNFLVMICNLLTGRVRLDNVSWDVIFAVGVWLIYCFLEVFNPRMRSVDAWMKSIRNMALYFFFVVLIVQISIESFHDMKTVMFVWSLLVVLAIIKAACQKYIGFTPGDEYFLNVMDGKRTHIIGYGTRYFSIFSDAANFGGSMGMSFVVFFVTGLHTKNGLYRGYYWTVAALACYGMFISGTRSALVIPAAGVMTYLILIKDFRKMIPVGLFFGLAVFILACTDIGQGNTTIRRARTVFHKDEDQSYIIRKQNRETLKTYMKELPFGNSLGMSAGRGQKYGDYSPISDIPTDSWFVQLWVETGVIGQCIYFALMIFLFIKAGLTVWNHIDDYEIKGYAAAMLSGVAGLFVMSSNNEVFTQFPNGVLVYTCFGLIFICPQLQKTK